MVLRTASKFNEWSDSFTFDTGLEPQLDSIAGRGHQAVFRVYLDYPGNPTGIPSFFLMVV